MLCYRESLVIVLLPLYRSLAQTLLPFLVLFQGLQCKRGEQDAPVSPGRFGLRFYCTTFQFDQRTLDRNYSFAEIDIAPFETDYLTTPHTGYESQEEQHLHTLPRRRRTTAH